MLTALLDEIRQGLGRFTTMKEKLTFTFEVWNVRGFELLQASPDAKDLYESSFQFASDITAKTAADFVAMVADVLGPMVGRQARVDLSPVQIAQVLANAVPGYKTVANTKGQLRELIAGLITVVLASLDNS